jgi:hypothetical protein
VIFEAKPICLAVELALHLLLFLSDVLPILAVYFFGSFVHPHLLC